MSGTDADRSADEPPEVLYGGVANAGAVVRIGNHVLRPSSSHTPAIHALLRHVRDAGFRGASHPVGVDPDGRERLDYIAGDVPLVPYPEWARSDSALISVARLMRRFHDATAGFLAPPDVAGWSTEMADPEPGLPPETVLCHNDACLENIVFRDGAAIGLLDFDFVAPGRRMFDLAAFARMCVPIDDDSCVRFGWRFPLDRPGRLRLVADAYGATPAQRGELLDRLADSIARGGEFLARRVAAGDQNFVEMWNDGGGMARFDRRREWFSATADRFRVALT